MGISYHLDKFQKKDKSVHRSVLHAVENTNGMDESLRSSESMKQSLREVCQKLRNSSSISNIEQIKNEDIVLDLKGKLAFCPQAKV